MIQHCIWMTYVWVSFNSNRPSKSKWFERNEEKKNVVTVHLITEWYVVMHNIGTSVFYIWFLTVVPTTKLQKNDDSGKVYFFLTKTNVTNRKKEIHKKCQIP